MQYTVFFQHTCPRTEMYGNRAGKPINGRILMKVVDAAKPLDVQRWAEADASPGWGTIVLLVFEGALTPIIKNDLVVQLTESK